MGVFQGSGSGVSLLNDFLHLKRNVPHVDLVFSSILNQAIIIHIVTSPYHFSIDQLKRQVIMKHIKRRLIQYCHLGKRRKQRGPVIAKSTFRSTDKRFKFK